MSVIDPTCKMELEDKEAKFKAEYRDKTYVFCSLSCKKKFEANPEKYLRDLREI